MVKFVVFGISGGDVSMNWCYNIILSRVGSDLFNLSHFDVINFSNFFVDVFLHRLFELFENSWPLISKVVDYYKVMFWKY